MRITRNRKTCSEPFLFRFLLVLFVASLLVYIFFSCSALSMSLSVSFLNLPIPFVAGKLHSEKKNISRPSFICARTLPSPFAQRCLDS